MMVLPMTLAEKITELPERFRKEDKSTACLLKEIGFLDRSQELKVEEVEDALRHHPDWAERWLERGLDQNLSGGWGIQCDHGRFRVQSYSSGRHLVEDKKLHAVAEFIVRYVGFVRDVFNRNRGPHPAMR
ncbi:MAG TPA: hypothetical protein VH189_02285 [Rhizomicrobium sp.]|jgi:hypothetical protein|nr:hypothetical protein [Rhizomicrobium sp.]